MSDQEQSTERASVTSGLRAFADFLDAHPAVPVPLSVHLFDTWNSRATVIAQWVDGLDELDIRPGPIDADRKVVRQFAGLEVSMTVRVDAIGEVRDVPTVKAELVPFTPAEIVARAAERVAS
jgi:hypothetical protein